ncbi:MAG TPA: pseudouridine synthase [Chloroflexota bacterium]
MAKERLQKVLASRGVASRRAAEKLIAAGLVTVNGDIASVGQSVDPSADAIRVRGMPVRAREGNRYIAVHKPVGLVTSVASQRGESTVMDLLQLDSRVFPAGRLDRDTSGLLLLTDDGEWANRVTHPRYEIEKEYIAHVRGHPGEEVLRALRSGVTLPDGSVTSPASVEVVGKQAHGTTLRVIVHEGRKRQIRLMLQVVGHQVERLQRVRVGPVKLGDLREGSWRHLTDTEVDNVFASARRRSASQND